MIKKRDAALLKERLEYFLRHQKDKNYHPSDISKILKKLKKLDKDIYLKYLQRIPTTILGDILVEFYEKDLEDAIEVLSVSKLINSIKHLESDDAADLLDDIQEISKSLAEKIFNGLDSKDKDEIKLLQSYPQEQAGAYMQTEIFIANHNEIIKDTIERFRILKNSGELENISSFFVVGDYKTLVATVPLDDLILLDLNRSFKELISETPEKYQSRSVKDTEEIELVAKLFEEYDLSVIPVIDSMGYVMGRITADDIYDIVQEIATEQMYNLAGVNEEVESDQNTFDISKTRGKWQFLNMCTAFFSATVIAKFQTNIEALPALAVLVPIVASMGGNTGNQVLTVMVRQLAIGEVDNSNWEQSVFKEILIAVTNGLIFAILVGCSSFLWFHNSRISMVMGFAILMNFTIAGVCGTLIPLLLKKMRIDPAVGSSILLTMITDALGFFIFLGLANLFLF